jgi:hypothetical protein
MEVAADGDTDVDGIVRLDLEDGRVIKFCADNGELLFEREVGSHNGWRGHWVRAE